MWMQLTQYITDHCGRFARLCCRIQAQLIHRIQDATLYRLLTVANIGQGAAFDYRDGVIKIGTFSKGCQGQGFTIARWRWGLIK